MLEGLDEGELSEVGDGGKGGREEEEESGDASRARRSQFGTAVYHGERGQLCVR